MYNKDHASRVYRQPVGLAHKIYFIDFECIILRTEQASKCKWMIKMSFS